MCLLNNNFGIEKTTILLINMSKAKDNTTILVLKRKPINLAKPNFRVMVLVFWVPFEQTCNLDLMLTEFQSYDVDSGLNAFAVCFRIL